jgi:hypothetical protein
MVGDTGLQGQFIQAIATQLRRLNVAEVQPWIDSWSAQISGTVTADPHKPTSFMPGDFETAVALARAGCSSAPTTSAAGSSASRPNRVPTKTATDFIWCNDCNDNSASIYPGAAEICGNQIDDACNDVFDEGCPHHDHRSVSSSDRPARVNDTKCGLVVGWRAWRPSGARMLAAPLAALSPLAGPVTGPAVA